MVWSYLGRASSEVSSVVLLTPLVQQLGGHKELEGDS